MTTIAQRIERTYLTDLCEVLVLYGNGKSLNYTAAYQRFM